MHAPCERRTGGDFWTRRPPTLTRRADAVVAESNLRPGFRQARDADRDCPPAVLPHHPNTDNIVVVKDGTIHVPGNAHDKLLGNLSPLPICGRRISAQKDRLDVVRVLSNVWNIEKIIAFCRQQRVDC